MDDLDRQIIAALQMDPRATWRALAGYVGISEATAARRARRLLDDGVVRVIGSPVSSELGLGFHVLTTFRCVNGMTLEVATRLAERPDMRFVSVVTGAFDVVAELLVPSRRQLALVMLEEFRHIDGIVEVNTYTVLKTYKVQETWSSSLLAASDGLAARPDAREWPRAATRDIDASPLDPVDLELLQLVSQDGRRSNSELAVDAGISESAVSRRLSALVQQGYVVFAALVDPAALGYAVEAYVWIKTRPGRGEAIAEQLAQRSDARYVSAVSGLSDVVCEVVLRSLDDLLPFLADAFGANDDVLSTTITHQLVTLKRGYLYPYHSLTVEAKA